MSMDTSLFFAGFNGKHIHLGVTGSVAACKGLDLTRALTALGVSVSATLTDPARRFVTDLSFAALGADPVLSSMFQNASDDPRATFAHLYPQKNAHALVIAPATADILARMAHGLAGDLLSCQALAFPGPVVVAPAMNPVMWDAPATRDNVATLTGRGVVFAGPVCGPVACGDTGPGRMAPVEDVLAHALRALSPQDLTGRRVLVTLGPTREFADPVRCWTNPSTGRMGACLAVAAWLRGAEVTAVCGPVGLDLPSGITRLDVTTAEQMHEAAKDLWPTMDIGCLVAAVADFRPANPSPEKLKKSQAGKDGLVQHMTTNPDILRDLGKHKQDHQLLLGFAAETSETMVDQARHKLESKNLDLIAANRIGDPDSGFGSLGNAVFVLDRHGRQEQWPNLPKPEVAWRLWDQLIAL